MAQKPLFLLTLAWAISFSLPLAAAPKKAPPAKAAAASAKAPPANVFFTTLARWKMRVDGGKGDRLAFDLMGKALSARGAEQGRLLRQTHLHAAGTGDLWGSLLSAVVLSDPALLQKDMGRWLKAVAQEPALGPALALARHSLALAVMEKDPGRAEALLGQSLGALKNTPFQSETAMVRGDLVMAAYMAGRAAQGNARLKEVRALYARLHKPLPGKLPEAAARVAIGQGRPAQAIPLIEESLRLFTQAGDKPAVVRLVALLGGTQVRAGQPDKALQALNRAVLLAHQLAPGGSQAEADALVRRATVWEIKGQPLKARADYLAALKLFEKLRFAEGEKRALWSAAQTSLATGQHAEAARLFGQLVSRFKDTAALYRVRLGLAQSLATAGRCPAARPHLEKAQELLKKEKQGDMASQLLVRVVKGRCLKQAGKLQEAADELGQARELAGMFKLATIEKEVAALMKGLPPPAKKIFSTPTAAPLSASASLSGSGSTALSASAPAGGAE